jgi:hypothetical protein
MCSSLPYYFLLITHYLTWQEVPTVRNHNGSVNSKQKPNSLPQSFYTKLYVFIERPDLLPCWCDSNALTPYTVIRDVIVPIVTEKSDILRSIKPTARQSLYHGTTASLRILYISLLISHPGVRRAVSTILKAPWNKLQEKVCQWTTHWVSWIQLRTHARTNTPVFQDSLKY